MKKSKKKIKAEFELRDALESERYEIDEGKSKILSEDQNNGFTEYILSTPPLINEILRGEK